MKPEDQLLSERTIRTLAPNARGGRFDRNFDFTTPELPCGRVTRLYTNQFKSLRECRQMIANPHMTRIFDPCISRFAL